MTIINKTFATVFNQIDGLREPLYRQRRRTLINAELEKYKTNMEMRTGRKPRPTRFWTAVIFTMICVTGYLGHRLLQALFFYDPISAIYGMLIAVMVSLSFITSYLFYKDPAGAPRKSNAMPLVSVIIATKNEPFLIYDAVDSCLTSSYKNLEVIIVNDGSDDNGMTAAAISDIVATDSLRVKTLHLERNMGKRKAMAAGFKMITQSEIVIFLDSDTIIEKDAISKLVTCMVNDRDLGAIVGYCRALNADQNALTKMQDTWYHSSFTIGKGMEHVFGTVTCCSGILSAYRVEAVKQCIDAWADDHFLGAEFMAGDDRQLTAYVFGGTRENIDKNARRWKTGYCESALSISETPAKLRKFVRQQIRWMQSWTRVFLFTAPWFWKGRHPLSIGVYYLTLGLSFVSPIIAVRNLVWAPLVEGQWGSAAIYVGGLTFLSIWFAINFKLYNPKSGKRWMWRIVFTFISVNVLYWCLYYAIITIRKNDWLTR
jgi:hyaluronan synthase